MSKGLVYFIAATVENGSRVKIGYTGKDVDRRLRSLQCGSPIRLGVYTAIEGNAELERLFHETFAPLRLHGEWFEVRDKLLDFLICLLDDAETRKPADWVNVLHAVEASILAERPYRETDDEEAYLASANTAPWEWMRKALAAEDAL